MARESVSLETTGMHCQSCAMLVEMTVRDLDGVDDVRVDLGDEKTEVTYDPDRVSVDDVIQEIVKVGYGASVAG